MRTRASVIFILLLLFLTAIAQNTEVVSLQILFWNVTMSRILVLLIALLIGIVIGLLLGRPWRRRRREPRPPAAEAQD